MKTNYMMEQPVQMIGRKITETNLKEMGWNKKLIGEKLSAPEELPNIYTRKYPMKVYDAIEALEAMDTVDFQTQKKLKSYIYELIVLLLQEKRLKDKTLNKLIDVIFKIRKENLSYLERQEINNFLKKPRIKNILNTKNNQLRNNCYNCRYCYYEGYGRFVCLKEDTEMLVKGRESNNFFICEGKNFKPHFYKEDADELKNCE